MTLPDYLYHYTSIESLALILKNRTIRFTALNRVDDETEGLTEDAQHIGQWVLVSCWTDNAQENIPLWHMYSKNMNGVRIKLKRFPFDDELFADNIDYQVINPPILYDTGKQAGFYGIYPKNKLYKIEYVNKAKSIKLVNQEHIVQQKPMFLNYDDIGKFKLRYWSFQEEWRYKIGILPHKNDFNNIVMDHNTQIDELTEKILNLFNRTKGLPKYIDMPLNELAINDMEIMLGPMCNEAEQTIVQTLLEANKVNANVTHSEIKIRAKKSFL